MLRIGSALNCQIQPSLSLLLFMGHDMKTTNAEDALDRLESFLAAYSKSRQLDQSVIHTMCDGGVFELRPSDIRACIASARANLAERQGEAVAWQCRSVWGDGFTEWQECSKEDYEKMAPLLMDCRGEALATQFRALYTHQAPAVVDDAMVERALNAYYCHGISWQEAAKLCGDTREEMRAALTAAALRVVPGWLPIETAPTGCWIIGYVPIKGHRLVMVMKTAQGLVLGEDLKPPSWPVFEWQPLPPPPAGEKE